MKKRIHKALKYEYAPIPAKLTGNVDIIGISSLAPGKRVTARALWDTGAEISVMTPEICNALELFRIGGGKIEGVNKTSAAIIVKATIILPNNIRIPDMRVWVCPLIPNTDILVGMDIIRRGDFAISNGEGKTLFTFAIPPFEDKTDLYEKAAAVNKENDS